MRRATSSCSHGEEVREVEPAKVCQRAAAMASRVGGRWEGSGGIENCCERGCTQWQSAVYWLHAVALASPTLPAPAQPVCGVPLLAECASVRSLCAGVRATLRTVPALCLARSCGPILVRDLRHVEHCFGRCAGGGALCLPLVETGVGIQVCAASRLGTQHGDFDAQRALGGACAG